MRNSKLLSISANDACGPRYGAKTETMPEFLIFGLFLNFIQMVSAQMTYYTSI